MVNPGAAGTGVECLERRAVQVVQEGPGRVGPTVSGGPGLQGRVGAAQVGGLPSGVEIAQEECEIGRVALVFVGVLHDEMLEVFQGSWGDRPGRWQSEEYG